MIAMCRLVVPVVQSAVAAAVAVHLLMNRIVQPVTDSDLPVRKNWPHPHLLPNRCPTIN